MVCTGLRKSDTPSLTSKISNSAFPPMRRSRIVWMLLRLMSLVTKRRPSRLATAAVTPLPPKKSATTMPSSLLALMMRSKRASGFWVA